METYESTCTSHLSDKCGEAAVYLDSAEEEKRLSKAEGFLRYIAWTVFAHVDGDERLESRGVVLRELEEDAQGRLLVFARSGWFQYSSAEQEVAGLVENLWKLANGHTSAHFAFLIV
jgi:hypothetical protein